MGGSGGQSRKSEKAEEAAKRKCANAMNKGGRKPSRVGGIACERSSAY